MSEYPTVGLGVDLSGIDRGEKAYQKLEQRIDSVGAAADRMAGKVDGSLKKTKRSNDDAAKSAAARAREEEAAARRAEAAAAREAREKERQRRYLQQVRIRSIQMEEAARRAADAEATRSAIRVQREQERAARESTRLAQQAAREQERLQRYLQGVRMTSMRWEEQAKQRARAEELKAAKAAEQERVRATREAEQERIRAARQAAQQRAALERSWARAARATGGGLAGGGGGGPPVDIDLNMVGRFNSAFHLLRASLRETRRLFFDLKTAVAVFLGGLVVTPLINMADQMTALRFRVAAFAEQASDVPYMMEAIYQAAQRSRAPLSSLATLYTRLIPLAEQLGKSQTEILRIAETIAKGLQIGGATAAETASASQQLAQAIASNRLGGDELRSLAENAPILLAKIAKALDMNTAQFIKWAHDGNATAETVVRALEKAQVEIDAIFAKFPVTIGQSMSLVTNALQNFIGQVNEATGASRAIAGAISGFAAFLEKPETINMAVKAVRALGEALRILGDVVRSLVSMWPTLVAAIVAFGGARIIAAITATTALRNALIALTAAAVANGRGMALLAVAQTAVASGAAAAWRGISSLIALMGGPLGITIIAATASVNAFANAQSTAAKASQQLKEGQAGAATALTHALDLADAYKLKTDGLKGALDNLLTAENDAASAAMETAGAHDEAAAAAMRRALAEKAAAEAMLISQAADLERSAREQDRAANGFFGTRRQSRGLQALADTWWAPPIAKLFGRNLQDDASAVNDRTAISNQSADRMRELAAQLRAAAEELRNQTPTITIPTKGGTPTPTPPKEVKGRDMTDERTAQILRMIAQAQQDELQARLALVKNVDERAAIEKRIIDAEVAEKIAQIDRQIANIEDDKKNTLAQQQRAELEKLKETERGIGRLKQQAVDEDVAAQKLRDAAELRQSAADNELDLMSARADLLRSDYARGLAEVAIRQKQFDAERDHLRGITLVAGYSEREVQQAQDRLRVLDQIEAAEMEQLERQLTLVNLIGEAADSVRMFKRAFKGGDIAGAIDGVMRTMELIQVAFQQQGAGGGMMALGSVAAQVIGGRTGRAVGGGLGIALGGGMLGSQLLGMGSMGALGGLSGGALALGSVLGPIALAAGALYAAAKIFNVGGKPSNRGAGYSLVTGQFSGGSRTQETEQAAKAAGDAIRGIQDALKAAGIGLTDAVHGLVIGTRDQTQIYLESGRTLYSAVGDSGAAVDTAMRALLEGATYVSDAQKKLVQDAMAMGKSFEDIVEILGKYEAAQKISAELADEILRLTDPKAYDLKAVRDAIAEQRKAAEQLAKDGYLTADQLSQINGQLATLEALRIDEVMKEYAESMDEALQAANDNVEGWRSLAREAYDAEAGVLRDFIERMRQASEGLRDFLDELKFGAPALLSPQDAYMAARARFEQTSALALTGDQKALSELQGVSEAYLEASRSYYSSTEPYFRDLEQVKTAVEAAADVADREMAIAQSQLLALDRIAAQLGLVRDALHPLSYIAQQQVQAMVQQQIVQAAANGNAPGVGADFDPQRYLASNPDLKRNWDNGGIMRTLGSTLEEALRRHYAERGQFEVAAGLRKYAKGAAFQHGQVIDVPTFFDESVMGEGQSPETIMPLARGPDGSLGVAAFGGGDSGATRDLAESVQTLTDEVRQLKVVAQAGHMQTIAKLGEVVEETGDLVKAVRASAA